MGSPYHQFCPVAKAMELFDERWTLLLVRELVLGSERFNDLRRGLPRMSPSLLSTRLHQLTVAGIVQRTVDGSEVRYVLTPAGRDLEPVVSALGTWGSRWTGRLGDEDLDPKLLMWDMHRNVDHSAIEETRVVVEFVFTGAPRGSRRWWLVIVPGEVDVCDTDPGFEVSVTVTAGLRDLTEIWRGENDWPEALRTGAVVVEGPVGLRRSLPSWFVSPLAGANRSGEPAL
ncbi:MULTISPECIES: winged helix-turn-helix transcriptional regulator [unclassified Rhodococcus (in: high G+C Gram-positive bacteria)]|uniref:winged helix-turn-helix transcriptional regulator n=1 Tax=unclassified Rhodococcus (in: high G+C Gram-positive bacteria) TaxID=192944 RepID=UPI00146AAFAA|nr:MULTISPECIES: helix-turn-helix domain-containing protein [unclassified Rhodococcus (in: high G+C Gram-positive bacteria)]MBF0660774.1 helix-turn-helix transcriptional regulator [Rhodococcus sp. (in: high G+C Gram-positive bacteria)]NMD96608.1 helix-turn-helix transcriptional regulator [Rhodococcus sp. BL-253-APC-6A1W]